MSATLTRIQDSPAPSKALGSDARASKGFRKGVPIHIGKPSSSSLPDGSLQFTSRLRQGDQIESFQVRFTNIASAPPSPTQTEAMIAAALLPAMRVGAPLRIDTEVDAALLANAERYQLVLAKWYPNLHIVPIQPLGGVRETPRSPVGQGVAVYFSGGVDSFYSLLRHRSEITHAVFVHGVDIELDNAHHRRFVSRQLQQACDEIGVQLIEVETDLRDFSDRYADWGKQYHGAGLAAIGLLLGGVIRKIHIAASETFDSMEPWGSSIMTDPLWSSGAIEVHHDGMETNRHQKVAAAAADPTFLRHLRVCWENEHGQYNCGRCEKCYRTMVALRVAGALDQCSAFGRELDLDEMVESELLYRNEHIDQFWRAMRATLGDRDPELGAALDTVLLRMAYRDQVKEFARLNREIIRSPQWQRLLPKIHNKLYDSISQHDPDWFQLRVMKQLPEMRELAFERLWHSERRWLKKRVRRASRSRLAAKIRRLLSRKP